MKNELEKEQPKMSEKDDLLRQLNEQLKITHYGLTEKLRWLKPDTDGIYYILNYKKPEYNKLSIEKCKMGRNHKTISSLTAEGTGRDGYTIKVEDNSNKDYNVGGKYFYKLGECIREFIIKEESKTIKVGYVEREIEEESVIMKIQVLEIDKEGNEISHTELKRDENYAKGEIDEFIKKNPEIQSVLSNVMPNESDLRLCRDLLARNQKLIAMSNEETDR